MDKNEIAKKLICVAGEVLKLQPKEVIASPTVWDDGKHKVSVYMDEAEGSHNVRHIHVSSDGKTGNLAIDDGRVLNGNLTNRIVRWARKVVLTLENKARLLQMIKTKVFYRLDRLSEKSRNQLKLNEGDRKSSVGFEDWDKTKVKEIQAVGLYRLLVLFADGKLKLIDIEDIVKRNPTVYGRMSENPEVIYEVKLGMNGHQVFWDDMMDFPSDYLYENGYEVLI